MVNIYEGDKRLRKRRRRREISDILDKMELKLAEIELKLTHASLKRAKRRPVSYIV